MKQRLVFFFRGLRPAGPPRAVARGGPTIPAPLRRLTRARSSASS
jgi:hypothetical protein